MWGYDLYDILTLLFSGLTAIGTIGAVIFSLWVLFDSKKIKYKMSADSATPVVQNSIKEVGINIVLTSNSKDNLIKISSCPKIKIKKNEYILLFPNFQSLDEYKIPKTLSYGDMLSFFLNQKQIKMILENKNKKFLFFFCDSLGKVYKVKIKRKLFEKQYIEPKE